MGREGVKLRHDLCTEQREAGPELYCALGVCGDILIGVILDLSQTG